MSRIYLNGDYIPLEQANVSVLDRGFTFGDGVYEVIPVFHRAVFRFERHMQRLLNSLEAIYMSMPLTLPEWQTVFSTLIDEVEEDNQSIYLQITRGISPRDHDIDLADRPTVFVMSRAIKTHDLSAGIKAISHDDIRWANCDIKAITLLPSVMLRHRAKLQGAKEAILFANGQLTEGAASNAFVVRDDIVYTTPKNQTILPGITRDLLLELLDQSRIVYRETSVSLEFVREADELLISSSTWEVVPVIKLDEQIIGNGYPGPIYQRLHACYEEFKCKLCE